MRMRGARFVLGVLSMPPPPLSKKDLPAPSFRLVFHPEDDDYKHFENAQLAPFDALATAFSPVNAWWLADAALLAYWDSALAAPRFANGGLQSVPFDTRGTQGYIASNADIAIVTFRGTEPDAVLDLIADARVKLTPWERPVERVHSGFRDALEVEIGRASCRERV